MDLGSTGTAVHTCPAIAFEYNITLSLPCIRFKVFVSVIVTTTFAICLKLPTFDHRQDDCDNNYYDYSLVIHFSLIRFICPFGPARKPSSEMCLNEIIFLIAIKRIFISSQVIPLSYFCDIVHKISQNYKSILI